MTTFSDAVAVVGFPSAANSPIILSEVDCSGLEEKMISCSSERPTSSCTPAGVTCVNSSELFSSQTQNYQRLTHVVCRCGTMF